MGTLYLICFADAPVYHAKHYLGYTERAVDERFDEHARGVGARVMRRVSPADAQLVRTWENKTRSDERALKSRKNHRGLCPRCRQQYNEDCRANVARSRQRKRDRARRFDEYVEGLKRSRSSA